MIRCKLCYGRVRVPERAWTETGDRRVVSFYKTSTPQAAYEKTLAELARKVPFIHEHCLDAAPEGTVQWPYMVALDLEPRLRFAKQLRERPDLHPEIPEYRRRA